MDGASSPAVTLDAPTTETAQETPITGSQEQGTAGQSSSPTQGNKDESASPAAQSEAQSTPSLDIDSLLQNEELVNKLLAHEKAVEKLKGQDWFRMELHRASSEAGRRAKAELEAAREQQENDRQARADAEAELKRILEADPYDVGEARKKEAADQLAKLSEDDQKTALQAQIEQAKATALGEGLARAGVELYSLVQSSNDLSDEDKQKLHPMNFNSLADFNAAQIQAQAKVIAVPMAKKLAETMAKAMVEERLGIEREGQPSPVETPQGGAAVNQSEFIAAYASGKSDDTARMMKHLKEAGIL